MNNVIDHFAIGADSLDQGVEMLHSQLGATIPLGGKHDAMSTHNCVAQAGNSSFLEIIAIDPDAPDPGRTRWFTLDEPATQHQLAKKPRALCWVVGTDNLDAVFESSPVDLGEVVTFTRGERSWRLTVPNDGSLPVGGLIPAFIEWSPGDHPSKAMSDVGMELISINAMHPDPQWLTDIYESLSVAHLVAVQEGPTSALSFTLRSPTGTLVQID